MAAVLGGNVGVHDPASEIVAAVAEAAVKYDVVVPTIGRVTLGALVQALLAQSHRPAHVYVVDDRPDPTAPLDLPCAARLHVLRADARGAAAARDAGWRAGRSPWVVFVDDDVVVPRDWSALLVEDLGGAPPEVIGVSGCIRVPLAEDRAPDRGRLTVGLGGTSQATADVAYRREALDLMGGFARP